MTKGIAHDLFARVMRMPARERSDILEFLGQSPVAPTAMSCIVGTTGGTDCATEKGADCETADDVTPP